MEHIPAALGLFFEHLFAIVLAGLLLSLLLCYAIQVNADKLQVPAPWLAWIPLLQIYPLVKSGGASFLHCVVMVLAVVPAALLAAVLGPLGFAVLLVWFVWMLVFFVQVYWNTAVERGTSGWVGILAMLPGAGVLAHLYVALHDGPAAPSRVGLVLGLVFFVLPAIPQLQDARHMRTLAGDLDAVAAASERGDGEGMARRMQSMLETMRRMNSFESEGDPDAMSRALSKLGDAAATGAAGDAQELEAVSPSFACPEGTVERGAAPPDGLERWCERGGVRHGGYASWFADGDLRETGRYRDGERTGVWTRWFATGGKRAQAEFAHDREHGLVVTWDEFGRLQQTARFREGRPADG